MYFRQSTLQCIFGDLEEKCMLIHLEWEVGQRGNHRSRKLQRGQRKVDFAARNYVPEYENKYNPGNAYFKRKKNNYVNGRKGENAVTLLKCKDKTTLE